MANKKRKCRNCKEYGIVADGLLINNGFYCCSDCATEYAINGAYKVAEKKRREKHKLDKERVKTRSEWLREAQQAFNKYIRVRDAKKPCISCGRFHKGQYHAGHYLTVGAHPEMRFNAFNVMKQCAPCNNHLSGNIAKYRIGLIKRYGEWIVDYLESPHPSKKYDIETIKRIKAIYTKKYKLYEKKFR
jgi:hypothetical protein